MPSFAADLYDSGEEEYKKLERTTARLEVQIAIPTRNDDKSGPYVQYMLISVGDFNILKYGSSKQDWIADDEYDAIEMGWRYGQPTSLYNSDFFTSNYRLDQKNLIGNYYETSINITGLNLLSAGFVDTDNNSNKGSELLLLDNISDLIFYFGTLLGYILRSESPVVVGNRRAPKPREALSVIRLDTYSQYDSAGAFAADSATQLLSYELEPKDHFFHLIAKSAHANLLIKAKESLPWSAVPYPTIILKQLQSAADTIRRVNEYLESTLFKEKPYQVECASTLLVPLELDELPEEYSPERWQALVRIFLKEADGQKVELDDVGSGIPFVLPVLYSAVSGTLSRLQQPELHLHPALQSDLSDVFLREIIRNPNKIFIIETHSEHLLLRLLRRIRDKEKNIYPSEMLPLVANDLSIYYFDPNHKNETLATRQSISPLGDFYHEWPRGFFCERDKDLFE